MLDRVVVRRCAGECYRLLDSEGGWLGCAPGFSSLVRFVTESGASVSLEEGRAEARGTLDRFLRRLQEEWSARGRGAQRGRSGAV